MGGGRCEWGEGWVRRVGYLKEYHKDAYDFNASWIESLGWFIN